MKITIEEVDNGYVIRADGTVKKNGFYIWRSVDILPMLEFIGEVILDKKVKVERR